MKMFADESEPVVVVEAVVQPVEVGIALVVVPPGIRHMSVALKGIVRDAIRATVP